jgi:hypothetical protein
MVQLLPGTRVALLFTMPPSPVPRELSFSEVLIVSVNTQEQSITIQLKVTASLLAEGVWSAMCDKGG